MTTHAKHIATRSINSHVQAALQHAGTDPLLAQLYAARNVQQADELDNSLAQLIPYAQLTNCQAAATRLADAIERCEKMLIIADYDADGATACSVGMKGLVAMGANVDFFVPNRFEHGYGLTPELADIAHEKHTQLIITVDNGISSVEGVARAKELGIDTIVTDHHSAGDRVPDCIIVNPNQRGCTFPSKSLAGVGVIFYVLIALRAELRTRHYFSGSLKEPKLDELLDLVALGTVADVVPLDHNNRILVSQGLKRIRAGKMSNGIRALFEIARRDPRKAQPFDMGFGLGPRVNAAGRLDDMSVGIACLLANDLEQAQTIASDLNTLNRERQEIEHGILQDVLAMCPETLPENQTTLSVYHEGFHQGVVGIVAGRLKERFYRPVFVFAPSGDGEIRGSGRSITGIHLRDVLDVVSKRCPDMIIKFGGHAMAAGLTLQEERFAEFSQVLEDVVRGLAEQDEDLLSQTYLTDGSLKTADLTIERVHLLNNQVWGQGFPPPSFADVFRVVRQQPMGTDKQHVKAWVEKDGSVFEAMFWRFNQTLPENVRLVYRPIVNEWRGNQELQLYVDYWEAV
ncbi:single-stranded-DNA-specific exonuclease RecJ [Kingella negevensis]|uniref:Single-stranded-DNA-specific exonuclease RecJ n=1 Tax=Kingella negevensis TaxID=1522312 RepID=A0A238HGQ0_9NEIS|nr:single-stranded-DNA-specific exonuclease RecJ [Kingella negevensis]MDK4696680.1 single-stranded-DNA-specific exonuclease RecJ [Kingella negevensis]SNB71605.1 Single-stranded-DNA-specific exonuclease RecJ [Kingella negevensis]